jgi:hypothetical protein
LKTERSTAARSLRAVALAITLVSVVTFAAVGYSAYMDISSILNVSKQGSPAITARTVVQGNSATVYVNATISNGGLFPLSVSLSCKSSQPDVTCTPGSISVAPGQNATLKFQMTVADVSQISSSSPLQVNGTLEASLVPFASVSVGFNLGSLYNGGGG